MRTTRTIALFATLAAGLVLASPASAQTPPRGTPNLAAMALAPSDLGPRARVLRQSYVRSQGIVGYVRQYRIGTARAGRKRLLILENALQLTPTVAQARQFMRIVPIALRTVDPDELAAEFERGSGGIRVTDVRVGKTARFRAGDRAYAKPVRITTRVGALYLVVAFVQVDRVLATLTFAGLPKVKVGTPEAAVLGRALARRISAALRPVSTSPPTVSGNTPFVGQTLAAGPGLWSNLPTSYSYAWSRCDASGANCSVISGATGNRYMLTSADVGLTIRVRVTARNRHGAASATSAPSQAVIGPPVNTALPTISGTVAQGQQLTAIPGTWTGSPLFTFQWRRCDAAGEACVDIAFATTQVYAVGPADAGFTIRVAVTGRNDAGSATAVSAQTTVVP
jgi:hypothetical protein